MNPVIKQKWVEALRSGEYKQGEGMLKSPSNKYCCLGVLTDLYTKEIGVYFDITTDMFKAKSGDEFLCEKVMEWAELADNDVLVTYDGHTAALSHLNDDVGLDFQEIADIIEKQV